MPEQEFPRLILLTPPGRGAVASLLVEGPGAVRAVAAHFHARNGRPLKPQPDQRLAIGRFGGEPGEEVVVRCRSAQAVELHCHGGDATVAMIQQVLVASGCRPLPWQEWVAAENADPHSAAAQLALAEARTTRTAAIFLDQYHGARARDGGDPCGHPWSAMGRRPPADRRPLGPRPLGRHLVEPWHIVVAGRPNVGKSSLINALVGYGRSIVHATAGTTRDVVTARTAIDGWPVILADTAGLGAGGDAVERAGIELAREQLACADLVLLVFDLSVPWSDADQALRAAWPAALLVHNKSDAAPAAGAGRPPGLTLSALSGQGLDALLGQIGNALVPHPPPPGAAVPFAVEHIEALLRMQEGPE